MNDDVLLLLSKLQIEDPFAIRLLSILDQCQLPAKELLESYIDREMETGQSFYFEWVKQKAIEVIRRAVPFEKQLNPLVPLGEDGERQLDEIFRQYSGHTLHLFFGLMEWNVYGFKNRDLFRFLLKKVFSPIGPIESHVLTNAILRLEEFEPPSFID